MKKLVGLVALTMLSLSAKQIVFDNKTSEITLSVYDASTGKKLDERTLSSNSTQSYDFPDQATITYALKAKETAGASPLETAFYGLEPQDPAGTVHIKRDQNQQKLILCRPQ